jgi:DNA-binding transcriptional LysR family regulator
MISRRQHALKRQKFKCIFTHLINAKMHLKAYNRFMNWDDIRFFLTLYRAGTLKAAAKTLKVDQATVGRRIDFLESTLQARLFERTAKGYVLTLAGERILSSAIDTEGTILNIERSITGLDERVEGTLRIAMPGALANHWLIPRLKGFTKEFPELQIQLLTGAEVLNLARREADLAIRLVKPTHSDLVFKKIGSLKLSLYGSKRLFRNGDLPEDLTQLSLFPFIGLYDAAQSQLERGLRMQLSPYVTPKILSSAWSSVFYAIKADLGLGILPEFLVTDHRDLLEIKVIRPAETPIWMVLHPDLQGAAKMKAMTRFLTNAFQGEKAN